tara:strand:+ start:3808 stop:4011 length:204 start_codon:yes stop_codon:yes gene_type:complete
MLPARTLPPKHVQEGKRKRGEFLPLLFFWRLFFFLFFVFFDSLSKYDFDSIPQKINPPKIPTTTRDY